MPTREQVIPKALEAIAAAHAGAAKAPPPRSSSLAGNAQAAAAPSAVAAETAGLAKTNEEFAKLEKELEAGASSAGEQAAAAVTTAVGDAGKVANTAVAEAGKAVEGGFLDSGSTIGCSVQSKRLTTSICLTHSRHRLCYRHSQSHHRKSRGSRGRWGSTARTDRQTQTGGRTCCGCGCCYPGRCCPCSCSCAGSSCTG